MHIESRRKGGSVICECAVNIVVGNTGSHFRLPSFLEQGTWLAIGENPAH